MSGGSSKVSAWLYYLKQLKRVSITTKEIINFFSACVRPVIEYACPVFHKSLPSYLSDGLEGLSFQKRTMRIINSLACPHLYQEALGLASLETLFERGQVQTVKLFQNISNNPDLANYTVFFSGSKKHSLNLNNNRRSDVPICKTDSIKIFFLQFFTEIVYRTGEFI